MHIEQICTHMGVVIVSQWCCSRRGTDSCACAHVQVNVSAVTACMHVQLKLACMHETLSKTAILSSIANN